MRRLRPLLAGTAGALALIIGALPAAADGPTAATVTGGARKLSAGPSPADLGSTLSIDEQPPDGITLDEQPPDGTWDALVTLKSGLTERSAAATLTFPSSIAQAAVTATPPYAGSRWPLLAGTVGVLALLAAAARLLQRHRRDQRWNAHAALWNAHAAPWTAEMTGTLPSTHLSTPPRGAPSHGTEPRCSDRRDSTHPLINREDAPMASPHLTATTDLPTSRARRRALLGLVAAAGIAAAMVFPIRTVTAAQAPVGLRTATSFAVLAGSGITNTGSTRIVGDVGTHPAPAMTGFGTVTLTGTAHAADAVALQAKNDLTAAYNTAAAATPTTAVATELGGRTLTPGVYGSPTLEITGTLTLDTLGDPDAVFIFKTASTLITASNSSVKVLNGATACNVFWQVGSSATLGTRSQLIGSVLAATSITATTGATIQGRLLAGTGAVTMDTNTITRPVCTPAVTPTTSPTTTLGTPSGPPTTGTRPTSPQPESDVQGAAPTAPGPGTPGEDAADSAGSPGGLTSRTTQTGAPTAEPAVPGVPTAGPGVPTATAVPGVPTAGPGVPTATAGPGVPTTTGGPDLPVTGISAWPTLLGFALLGLGTLLMGGSQLRRRHGTL